MAVYGSIIELKNAISDSIYLNSSGLVTADILRDRLHDIVDTLDDIDAYIGEIETYLESPNSLTQLYIGNNIAATRGWVEAQGYLTEGGGGTDDHSELENLDYESSGHTGFAPISNPEFSGLVKTDHISEKTLYHNLVVDSRLYVAGNRLSLSDTDISDSNRYELFLQCDSGSMDIHAYKYGTGAGYKNIGICRQGGNVEIGQGSSGGANKLNLGGSFYFDAISEEIIGTLRSSATGGGYLAVKYQTNDIGKIGTRYRLIGSGTNRQYDFGIRAEANLSFATGGAYERMFIKSDGKIGIGNSDPAHELDVTGTIVSSGDIIAYHT